jgi:hypothetical protein
MKATCILSLSAPFAALAIACGGSAGTDPTGSALGEQNAAVTCSADRAGSHDKDASTTTKTGATLSASVVPLTEGFPTGAGCAGDGIIVGYNDVRSHYHNVSRIFAVVSVRSHTLDNSTPVQVSRSATIDLSLFGDASNKTNYTGILCGLGGADFVDEIELAVTDASKTDWDSNDSSNYVFRLANHEDFAEGPTGVGGKFTVDLVPAPQLNSGACGGEPMLAVTYIDKANHFGGKPMTAFAKQHYHKGPQQGTQSSTIEMRFSAPASDDVGGALYIGQVCGIDSGPSGAITDRVVFDSVELAFSNADRTIWDSNLSRNYVVNCAY